MPQRRQLTRRMVYRRKTRNPHRGMNSKRRSASWAEPGGGKWRREQSAAERLRGRTATSKLFLTEVKWWCWYTKPRRGWQRFKIVIRSMARKRAAANLYH